MNVFPLFKFTLSSFTFSVHMNLLFFLEPISSVGVSGDPFISSAPTGTFLSPMIEIGWTVSGAPVSYTD